MKEHVADEERVHLSLSCLRIVFNGLMMKNGYDDLLKNENRDEEPMTENDNDELLIMYCKLAASTAVFISISMMLITELSDLDFH